MSSTLQIKFELRTPLHCNFNTPEKQLLLLTHNILFGFTLHGEQSPPLNCLETANKTDYGEIKTGCLEQSKDPFAGRTLPRQQ